MVRRTPQFTLRRFWNSVFDSLTLQKQQQYELHECRYRYFGVRGYGTRSWDGTTGPYWRKRIDMLLQKYNWSNKLNLRRVK